MKRLLVIIALFAATAAPLVAEAQDPGRAGAAAGGQAPLSRVLHEIAARYPGRHLNTTMSDSGGRSVYMVQWQLSDGRIVIFVVDAASGQIIGRQGG